MLTQASRSSASTRRCAAENQPAASLPLFALGYYSRLAVWLAERTPRPPELADEHPFRAFIFLAGLAFLLLKSLVAGGRRSDGLHPEGL